MHRAFIGMGANLESAAGRPEATLAAAADRLDQAGRLVRRSSLWSTEPVGYAAQPRFVNAVVEIETEREPHELLTQLMAIEREFGRDRSAAIPNGPRTLDLDILLYDELVLDEPGLQIPHPRLAERLFVLVPLAEIAPTRMDARSRQSVAQLLHRLQSGSGAGSASDAAIPIDWDGWRAGPFDSAHGSARAGSGGSVADPDG
jgi:2-amino-4-hydroxy-6-hydroxymethyldihydropteridine diphosphokinase